jgi:hypothetical protein
MPGGIDGWELADLTQQARPGLTVLLTTGYSVENLDQARSSPHVPYFQSHT